ncbi:MAG TPA: hypothetical protein VHB21_18165 [Minicystis sp.]|nr:hypothetical protein [Minicystis sp.]
MKRARRLGSMLPLGALVLAAAGPALAAPRDKAALRLDDEAMGKDYLETNFLRAQKKLAQAIAICGAKACTKAVMGQLHRDLAVVLIGGLSKNDEGRQEFARARELDPNIELDPDYATPAMKKMWAELKGAKPARAAEAAATGEPRVEHTPVTEQRIGTPVPIYAEFAGGDPPAMMRLFYKGVGASRFVHVDMKRRGEGFAAEIPCSSTSRAGEVHYYVVAQGPDGESLAHAGSHEQPLVISVKRTITSPPPHLPDAEPPARCTDVACEGPDCEGAHAQHANEGAGGERRNWITIAVEQDFALVGAGTGVCTEAVQVDGEWSCFRAAGSQYHGNPVRNKGDEVNGGFAPATTRVLLGFDRVLAGGLVAGVHGGVVVRGGGPRPDGASSHAFFPAHVEARLAYWFGHDVFSTAGFRPFVFGSFGAAQVDIPFQTPVKEDRSKPPPVVQPDNPNVQELDAWRRMGQAFGGGGLGAMIAFTPGFGFVLDVKYMHLFPTSGNVVAPEGGFAFGF